MWRFLADRGRGPSGTYYRRESVPVNHYWHALDQVLVRPELADKVVNVEILDHDGTEPLTHPDGGWPDPDQASDHLPLLFTINP
jgi:endonuclease/exonuclease/phosphatase family metal-dependent hydrolase